MQDHSTNSAACWKDTYSTSSSDRHDYPAPMYCRHYRRRIMAPLTNNIDINIQVVSGVSDIDVYFEASGPLGCTILHHTVQSLAGSRPLSVCTRKRSSHRSSRKLVWIALMSVHIDQSRTCQTVSCIKASGAHRCSPTDGPFIVCRPPSYVAVRFPTASFDRNHSPPNHAHWWFRSYLVGRMQYIRRGALRSAVRCAAGICSGAATVHLYTFNLIKLIEGYDMALGMW